MKHIMTVSAKKLSFMRGTKTNQKRSKAMNLKKAIAAGIATALLCAPALGVSAAEMTPNAYVKALKESGKESLIIDVEAYKAAYSDLTAAFGDNTDAYIEHYLTVGIREGRTKGVLFDPLAYAEAYGDIKAAYGDDILAIVNHYVTFGVTENRTLGTANGYADIAEAAAMTAPATAAVLPAGPVASSPVSPANVSGESTVSADDGSNAAAPVSYESAAADSTATNNVTSGNTTPAAVTSDYTASGSLNNTAPVPPETNPSADNAANNESYGHTTSHYGSDGTTLVRVEYYDNDNNLIKYSEVTDFDSSTNSYTEHIYNASDMSLDRTDTYVNGSLSSSGNP